MASTSGAEGQRALDRAKDVTLLGTSVGGEVGSRGQHGGGRLQVMPRGPSDGFLEVFVDCISDRAPFCVAKPVDEV